MARYLARKDVAEMTKEGKIDNSNLRITNQIGINPKTGKEAFLFNDGSFSDVEPGVKPKEMSAGDYKHIQDMISNATGGGKTDPSASDIEIIRQLVAPKGFDFQPVTKITKNDYLPDSTETKWQLVPKVKDGGGGNANLPPGAKTGSYGGVRGYSTDGGQTIYDMNGKRLK
jgi:hypothetical protein